MYKVFIILFLISIVIIYLSNDCLVKEPFSNLSPGPVISYTNAEKEKTLQILKDHYEIEALLNIAQVAKGLSTDGYTVPGTLKVKGSLEVGDNIKITSNTTDGDVITVGSGIPKTGTNGKVRINIGKYSLVPNLSTGDNVGQDYLEFRYNNDGTAGNDKVMGKISRGPNDKFLIYNNDNNTNYFYVKNQHIGFSGEPSNIYTTNVNTENVRTNNILNTLGDSIVKFENNQTKLCNGSNNCSRFLYVNKTDTRAGYASNNDENTNFIISSAGDNPTRRLEIMNTGPDTKIWKNGQERMIIEPGATKIPAATDWGAKHFYIAFDDGDLNIGAWNTKTNNTYLGFRNREVENNIQANHGNIFINNNGHRTVEINKNGGIHGHGDKIFSVNGPNNDSGHLWVDKKSAIGSYGKYARDGNCKDNWCNMRVNYCKKQNTDEERNLQQCKD